VIKEDPRRKKKIQKPKKKVNENWTMSGIYCSLFATTYYPHPAFFFKTFEKNEYFSRSQFLGIVMWRRNTLEFRMGLKNYRARNILSGF